MSKTLHQRGLSLIELMIAILLGIFIVGAALTVYVNTVVSSTNTMKMSMLNQELGTMMNVMVSEIRRAGFNNAVADDPTGGIDNEFQRDSTPEPNTQMIARVILQGSPDTLISPGPAGAGTTGDCILFAYDANENSTPDDTEFRGFKLNGGGVAMRSSVAGTDDAAAIVGNTTAANYPDDCANGSWETVTDTELITITNLAFGLEGSECYNSGTTSAALTDCYANPGGIQTDDVTVEAYLVSITLEGELKNDALVKLKLEQSVRIRNEIVRERQ